MPTQDDIYRYNGYLSLMEFRELTLQRLKKFVAQKFFTVTDYTNSGCGAGGMGSRGVLWGGHCLHIWSRR